MSVVEMSFDLSDTAAAYCDASVGALELRRGRPLLHTSWLQSQTQICSACPSTQFTDTKEVQFFFFVTQEWRRVRVTLTKGSRNLQVQFDAILMHSNVAV